MRKIYLTLILGLLVSASQAQISSKDTVCKGNSVAFTPGSPSNSYAWALGNLDYSNAAMTAQVSANLKGYGTPQGVCMKIENGSYVAFVTTYTNGLLRLNYGPDPLGAPAITNLGTFGGQLDSVRGIDIVQDAGNWYCFVARSNKLIRLTFGPSLFNTPTATTMNVGFGLSNPYQLTLVKFNNEWLAFAANAGFNDIVRMDIGLNITNPPASPLQFIGGNFNMNTPHSFSFINRFGTWYMLIASYKSMSTNFGRGFLTYAWFGNDLKHVPDPMKNNPKEIGPISGASNGGGGNGNSPSIFKNPTSVTLIQSCDTVYALVTDSATYKVTQMGFDDGVLSHNATSSDLGDFGLSSGPVLTSTFWHDNKLCMLATMYDSTLVVYDNMFALPSGGTVNYTGVDYNATLPTGGLYRATVFQDLEQRSGSSMYCKDVYAIDNVSILIKQFDTLFVATGSKCDVYEWRKNGVTIPGATTDTLTGLEDGAIYTVIGQKAGCTTFSTVKYFAPFSAGVGSLGNSSSVSVYPNPSTGVLRIKASGISNSGLSISCYNMMGSLVKSVPAEAVNGNVNTSVDLSGLPKGVYQLRIQSETGSNIQQIVLE